MKTETQVSRYLAIQPLLLELMEMQGNRKRFFQGDLFPRLVEAVSELPPSVPALIIGFEGSYFLSPFNTVQGDRYAVCKSEGLELAGSLMDCIYAKFFVRERLAYLRGVMPQLMGCHDIPPDLRTRILTSFLNGDASLIPCFLEDVHLLKDAILEEGGQFFDCKLPLRGSVTRQLVGPC